MPILSVVIPARNEEASIAEVVKKVAAAKTGDWQKEIIVIDDGSTDKTREILMSLKKEFNLILVKRDKGDGKGRAIREGFLRASGEAVLVQDADLEYDPSDYEVLLQALTPGVAAVYGRRAFRPGWRGYSFYILGSWLVNGFLNLLFRAQIHDSYTCYKLIHKNWLSKLKLTADGFEIEAEVTARLLQAGGKIAEVPIHYFPRTFQQGKKIRAKDGWRGLKMIWKCWLNLSA